MNPDLHPVRCQWLREGHHGGARALQDLALNLYSGRAWAVDMRQVCGLSDEDRDAALSLRMDDRILGERNYVFMAQCRESATARLGQPQAVGG
ncbi:hypothetical protein [Thiocapsa marina]|nr:hypothetical protein [Thiocapsa marina]